MNTLETYPLLPIRNTVAFPGVTSPFLVKRPGSVAAVRRAQRSGGLIVTVAQKAGTEGDPSPGDLFRIGTLMRIEKAIEVSGGYQLLLQGLERFRIDSFERVDEGLATTGERLVDASPETDGDRARGLYESLKELAHEVLELLPGDTRPLIELLEQVDDPALLANLCAMHLDIPLEQKQKLLEDVSVAARLADLLDLMKHRRDALRVQSDIRRKMSESLSKTQRDALLREQLKAIRQELHEEGEDDFEDLRKKIDEAGMPEETLKTAHHELKRLESIGGSSPEANVIRNYLDWLCAMPWQKTSGLSLDEIDLDKAAAILDADHYGLERIKKRVLQHLAVIKLKKKSQGTILCLVGPPGVGKTSLGQSIARALGRKFTRVSLGGVRDDAEIRGHRRTYIGAMPGRIVQGVKRAGVKDAVFLLDEIDKLSHGIHGDPSAAMLEVLDPEQNSTFTDHYLDVPFDLSSLFFICTANSLDGIPGPLLDRMEVIEVSGYTHAEKLHIARNHLVPKQLREHGLSPEQAQFTDEALSKVISSYTRESGVRGLQRQIGALCRAATERVVRGGAEGGLVTIDLSWLDDVLGPERYAYDVSEQVSEPGVATGLAWTPHGGDILFIEATSMPGSGRLTLTGQLGDVMKESAQIAMSLVKSRLAEVARGFDFDKKDIHIHVPAGAIPKDGPSAGVTLMTALASLASGHRVDPKVAMTGEITLRGHVLPVGGIKEKVIAAHRAGIRKVILSSKNRKDLRDVPEEVRSQMQFDFVERTSQVLDLALERDEGDRGPERAERRRESPETTAAVA